MKINFRNASIDDSDLLLKWRNDPVTRINSINTDIVPQSTHVNWLAHALKNPNQKLLIATMNHQPVGMVRFDLIGSRWELSWTISPEERGRGIGKEIVKQATSLLDQPITAKIKEENIASIKIALYAGFVETNRHDGVIYYTFHKDGP